MAGPWEAFAANRPRVEIPTDQIGAPAAQPEGPWSQFRPSFTERAAVAPSTNAPLQAGLENVASAMRGDERGPAVADPAAQLTGDFMNQGSAASQRTTPNIPAQMKNFISDEVHENDAGEVLYRDRESGKLVPTDQKTQVALRDPQDGKVKVFARSPDTDEGILSSAGRLLGTGMAAGAPTARPSIPLAPAMQPKASDIFATAKPFYRAFRDEAGKISVPVETANGIGERIRSSLTSANLIPELAQPVYSAVAILDKEVPLTLDALQNIKRVVGRSFNSPDKNIRDAAAVASKEINKVLSEVAPEAAKNLKMGDDIHSTARSVQDLQRKSDVADLRKGRAGYGGNAVNSMRQVLSPIVQKAVEGKMTGFKPAEIQAMRDIVEGTPATNAARLVGQLSPTKGIMATAASGGAALSLSNPYLLAIPALGAASNKLATVLTGKQIDRLRELVAKRSPAYAEAVKRSVKRYEDAQAKLVNDPSPARMGGYVAASRALASGLTRDGLQITSADLMRSLQLGGVGRAEDEGDVPREPSQ